MVYQGPVYIGIRAYKGCQGLGFRAYKKGVTSRHSS